MKKIILALLVVSALQGCTREIPTVKSPCVGAEGSPCGTRVPVNEHWLKDIKVQS